MRPKRLTLKGLYTLARVLAWQRRNTAHTHPCNSAIVRVATLVFPVNWLFWSLATHPSQSHFEVLSGPEQSNRSIFGHSVCRHSSNNGLCFAELQSVHPVWDEIKQTVASHQPAVWDVCPKSGSCSVLSDVCLHPGPRASQRLTVLPHL